MCLVMSLKRKIEKKSLVAERCRAWCRACQEQEMDEWPSLAQSALTSKHDDGCPFKPVADSEGLQEFICAVSTGS